jgi:hypothetical protein
MNWAQFVGCSMIVVGLFALRQIRNPDEWGGALVVGVWLSVGAAWLLVGI